MYRAWVEEVLGLKVYGDHLQLNPVIPGGWEGFHLRYRHGEAIYEIQVENPEGCERGVSWVEMDGQRLRDGVIPLERNLVKHRILVRMGKSDQASCDVPPADRHPSADRNPGEMPNGEIKLFPGKDREKL
jgi:cyclic beta-1,2-glucan synthetase